MKKALFAILISLGAVGAHAGPSPVYEVAYGTFVVVGVQLNSAPAGATLVNSRPSGFSANIGRVRLVNPHPSWDIFVGDANVSTNVFSANVGQLLKAAGGTADWYIDKDPKRGSAFTPIYARPADSAAVDRLPRLSVIFFGY